MGDRRLSPRYFDPNRELVWRRAVTFNGEFLEAGTTVTDLDKGQAMRMWTSGRAIYKEDYKPTPVQSDAEAAADAVKLEETGGGWYVITAPWLQEAEKVQGKDAAEARRQELIEAGDPKGVTVTATGGGWYEVKAEWAEEPEKVQGLEAAEDRADELREEGPPATDPNASSDADTGGGGQTEDEMNDEQNKPLGDGSTAPNATNEGSAEAAVVNTTEGLTGNDESKEVGNEELPPGADKIGEPDTAKASSRATDEAAKAPASKAKKS